MGKTSKKWSFFDLFALVLPVLFERKLFYFGLFRESASHHEPPATNKNAGEHKKNMAAGNVDFCSKEYSFINLNVF